MDKKSKAYLFEEMPVPQAVMSMSIPTVISSLVTVIYNLSDTYFVGQLNDPIQNAAVTLASPIMLAFYAITNLFGVGGSSMMSRALGLKDLDTVHRTSAFSFYCGLFFSAMYSVIMLLFKTPLLHMLGATTDTWDVTSQYLQWTVTCGAIPAILNIILSYMVRAEGSSLHASIGTMSGCILNIILDPFFIMPWGLNLGAAGAGLATFIANCIAFGYFCVLLYVKRRTTQVRISPKWFKPRKDIVSGVCAVGIPAAIQNLLNVTGMTILNNFTSSYGSNVVAAMGIAQRINQVPFQISLGFSQGIMPIIGYNFSARNNRRMKDTLLFAARIMLISLAVMSVLFWLNAGTLVRLFMNNEEVISLGTSFLHGFAPVLPFLAMDFLGVGVYQACGYGKISFFFAILRKIILEIPAIFILNLLFPMYGLAYSQLTAEVIMAIAAVSMLTWLFKKFEREF